MPASVGCNYLSLPEIPASGNKVFICIRLYDSWHKSPTGLGDDYWIICCNCLYYDITYRVNKDQVTLCHVVLCVMWLCRHWKSRVVIVATNWGDASNAKIWHHGDSRFGVNFLGKYMYSKYSCRRRFVTLTRKNNQALESRSGILI